MTVILVLFIIIGFSSDNMNLCRVQKSSRGLVKAFPGGDNVLCLCCEITLKQKLMHKDETFSIMRFSAFHDLVGI